ncbi:dextransucrase DSRB family protein, partial [Yersinia pestis PY-66]
MYYTSRIDLTKG